jgi:uncharacterized protein
MVEQTLFIGLGVAEAEPAADCVSDAAPSYVSSRPVQLGRVVCLSGSQVVAVLDPDACRAGGEGELRKGQLVKMVGEDKTILGMVVGLSIPVPSAGQADEAMLAELELIGEIPAGEKPMFRRGVSNPPALGEPVYLPTPDQVASVYDLAGDTTIRIGELHQAGDRSARLSVDGLLGKHFAVLGTTGTGKSCAVSLLLQRILEKTGKAHIVLLDPHSEYSAAFGPSAEYVTPQNLELPYWLLTADEITEVVRDSGEHASEGLAILKELIPQARRAFARTMAKGAEQESHITVDTPVPYSMREIFRLIDEFMGRLEKHQPIGPFRWLKARLEQLRTDSRYSFMFGGITVRDNMADIVARLFRIPVNDKPITIMDLSGVPSEVLNVVVSVVARMTFDFALWSRSAEPVLLVCEEAHRYAPVDPGLGFEPTKEALARIAKEGRKYGVSLAIISQRPSEIAPTILSQCNTSIAFRMTSLRDQELVRGIMQESAFGLLDFLPSLGNGECIIAGEAVSVPQRVRFDLLPADRRPRSATAAFSKRWTEDKGDPAFVADVIDRWRRQIR